MSSTLVDSKNNNTVVVFKFIIVEIHLCIVFPKLPVKPYCTDETFWCLFVSVYICQPIIFLVQFYVHIE